MPRAAHRCELSASEFPGRDPSSRRSTAGDFFSVTGESRMGTTFLRFRGGLGLSTAAARTSLFDGFGVVVEALLRSLAKYLAMAESEKTSSSSAVVW